MKKVSLALLSTLLCINVFSQAPGCPDIDAGPDVTLDCEPCTDLTAIILETGVTTGYDATSIPYAPPYPFNTGTPILVNIDDIWSGIIDLPFNFCFYDNMYDQIVVGANGVITFDINSANDFCAWSFNASLPSTQLFHNCIFGAYHDIDPSVSGNLYYGILGAYPCRTFVVNYYNVAHFSCNNLATTQQIVIYESTNVIEVYIEDKPVCATWNSGNAVIGVQDATGTNGVTPAGYNTGPWAAGNLAFRFTPNGTPNWVVNWYEGGALIGTGLNIQVCPSATTTYTGEVIYSCCDGTTVTETDDVVVNVINSVNVDVVIITPEECDQTDGAIDISASGGAGSPFTYEIPGYSNTTGNFTGLSAGTYNVTITDAAGCSVIETVIVDGTGTVISGFTASTNQCLTGNSFNFLNTGDTGGGITWNWTFQNGNPAGSTNENPTGISWNTPGQYTIIQTTSLNNCDDITTFVIEVFEEPVISLTTANVTCFSYCDGTAASSIAGGALPYSYIWDNGAGNGADASGLCAQTTYNVTVTDNNGCTGTGSFTPTEPPELIISTGGVDPTCGNNNGEASVNATGGTPQYNYLWDDPSGQTTPTATGLYAGTYTVIVTDANGCSVTETIIINDVGAPTISVTGTDATCFGWNDGQATVIVNGGQSPYNYQWDDPGNQTTPDATGLPAGTYNVTITDALGCEATGQIIINQPEQLLLSVTGTDPFCFESCDGTATATASGGTGTLNYLWDNGADPVANPGNLCGGITYNITVTDENGCINTGSFTPTDPSQIILSTSGTDATCGEYNGTVSVNASGGTPGYTYLWDDPAGQTTPDATGLSSGTYTVIVTDLNGCTESAIAQINDIGGPTVSISGIDITCFGGNDGEVTITASGDEPPFTYLWDDPAGQTTPTATGLFAGTYNVTVTDNAGCNSYATITLSEPSALVLTVTGIDPSCNGVCDAEATAAVTGGTGSLSYLWNDPAAQNNSIAVDLCGNTTYTVLITDENGCTITGSFTPVEPELLTLSVTGTDPSCNGVCDATASGNAGGGTGLLSYLWDNGAGTGSDATGLCGDITYTLIVTDENGCTITGSHTPVEPAGIIIDQTTTTDVTCFGNNNGTITVVSSGGSGTLLYDIPGYSGTTGFFAGLGEGSYTVTITDINGCTNTVTLTIYEPPQLVVTLDGDTICIGESTYLTANATGGSPGYDYTWNPAADGQSILVSPVVTTNYSVLVTDSNFCVTTANATVFVHPPLAISAYPNDTICPGESSTFFADYLGGMGTQYSFTVNGAAASQPPYTVTPNVTTTFEICITDGCSTPQVCDSVIIVVMDNPPVDFTSDIVDGCVPITVTFSEINPHVGQTYAWNFDDPFGSTTGYGKNPVHTFDNPGTYDITCTVTSQYGCVNTYTWEEMITVYPNPIASFLPYPQVASILKPEIFFDNTSSSLYDSYWEFGDGNSSVETHPMHNYSDPGTYTVQLIVTTEYNCVDSAYTDIIIEDVITFYAPTAFSPDFDQMNALFSPVGHGIDPDNWYMAIYDRWGEKVFETTIYDVDEETYQVRYGWDGLIKGKKIGEVGAYSWLVIYRDLTGAEHQRHGLVVLVR